MPYEWGRLSDVFDAGSCLRSMSAWLVVRWAGRPLASAPCVAAGIGESSLMLLGTCYTDYILILY